MRFSLGSCIDIRQDLIGIIQAFRIDVKQAYFEIAQFRSQNTVADDVSREDGAAGADKCDFNHGMVSL